MRGLAAVLALLIAPPLPAATAPVPAAQEAGADEGVSPGWCIVCRAPAPPGAITELHKGRRVTVCNESCRAEWHARRDELFAALQARGALFDETAMSERSLVSGWMWLGTYVLAGLICGALSAYLAFGKGLSPLPWLLAGLLLNVVALVLLALRPRGDLSRLPEGVPAGLQKIPSTRTPLRCTRCGRDNHPSARCCSSCGAPIAPRVESEVRLAHGDGRR
jgi:ribosomal protein L37E